MTVKRRARGKRAPAIVGAAAALLAAGCGREPGDGPEKGSPPAAGEERAEIPAKPTGLATAYRENPEFRKALDELAERRKELAKTRNRLVAEMRTKIDAVRARLGEGATDAAIKLELEKDEAWNALFKKVKDVNTAFDDIRQKTVDVTRGQMKTADKEISK